MIAMQQSPKFNSIGHARAHRHRPTTAPPTIAPATITLLALCAVAMLVAMAIFRPSISMAANPLFSPAGAAELNSAIAAVAISADESLLAAATRESGGQTRVNFYDRRSMNLLGALRASVGRNPRVAFSPAAEEMVIWGDRGIELWEVPIAPLDPGGILDSEHRRWRKETDGKPPLVQAGFGEPPKSIYWIQGGNIHGRDVKLNAPDSDKPLWKNGEDAKTLAGFSAAPRSGILAVIRKADKSIGLMDPSGAVPSMALEGHRFPVLALAHHHRGTLLSIDGGNTVIRWTDEHRQQAIKHLKQIPKGFTAAVIAPLVPPYWILRGSAGDSQQTLLINTETGAAQYVAAAKDAAFLATSPTGKYLLLGQDRALSLQQFAYAESPSEYVRRLHERGAYQMARNYAQQLDTAGLGPQAKSRLQYELKRVPPSGLAARDFLDRLADAEKQSDADAIRYWAGKILDIAPGHPQALLAIERLGLIQERKTLETAREAMERGETRIAINMLSNRIGSDSPHFAEAQSLIREAEAKRRSQTALDQAREKMNLNNFPAARAIVAEVMRRDADNRTAVRLMEEIDDRAGGPLSSMAVRTAIILLLVAAVGTAYSMRSRWLVVFRRRSATATDSRQGAASPGGQEPGPRPKPAPRAGRGQRTQRAGAAPQPERDRRAEMQGLLNKTEEIIATLRKRDAGNVHTTALLEIEAELQSLHRRVADGSADYRTVVSRLNQIQKLLQRLQTQQNKSQGAPNALAANEVAENLTYYELLKIPPDASQETVKSAYLTRLKEYHPDLHSSSDYDWIKTEAERMSKRIGEAYAVLKDAVSRKQYDRKLMRNGR